ncbi:MAG: pyridoxal-dependent decarboxylase [Saprospiraceae bacterium]|nr:pyridoxal-dependent decarboxylase [Saprospiraceae bacterium]
MHPKLKDVYNPENFRAIGHQLVDLLADSLHNNLDKSREKVIDYISPEKNYTAWEEMSRSEPITVFKKILENSIQLQHPGYMGHQVCVPAPLAVLAGFQGLMLNSGGAIYEMSAAASTIEKLCIDKLKPFFGFTEGDGILTSGGTIANLTALICARNIKAKEEIWSEGQNQKYAFMVSEEAHYCIERAVKIMGWGDEGIIKIPVDGNFVMKNNLLEQHFQKAKNNGIRVIGVVGSAPTTSTGKYDELKGIGKFCKIHNLWFHIDAAHGGPAVFSEKYKHLMAGCELADSITVDAHKMMMVPSLTTMLFFAKSDDSYKTFAQKAQYLFFEGNQEWYNYGKRTMECTKVMLSTRVFMLLHTYGTDIFGENIDACYENAGIFAGLIKSIDKFELAVEPDSNILCFRYKSNDEKYNNSINSLIRSALLNNGKFYIVQTTLNEKIFLRVSLMNPFTDKEDMMSLLKKILELAGQLENA